MTLCARVCGNDSVRVIKAAFGAFDGVGSGAPVPSEFCLLRAGWNDYVGDRLLFDEAAASSVMERYTARGLQLTADYEHQSLAQPPIIAPASAKKWIPELRNGELWATQIAWTDRAKSMLAAGEYRYFSIACKVDPETARVVEIINFALTNLPAADGIAPLMAARATPGASPGNQESGMSKTVIVALGLSAETVETDAALEAARLVEFRRDVLALTAKGSTGEALGVLRAMQQSHEREQVALKRLGELEAERRVEKFDTLVAEGQTEGKLSPAMAKSEWVAQMRAREDGVDTLRAFLASAPKLVKTEAEQPKVAAEVAPAGADELTADEIAVAKTMAGPDREAFKRRLEALKAQKRADKDVA